MNVYDKPFRTPDQMISILISRGLYIDDKNLAKYAIMALSYFDLFSSYKAYMLDEEHFIPGTSFEDVYSFRIYDIELQNAFFKYSSIVENRFKNILAYHMSKRYGEHQDSYLNAFHYATGSGENLARFEKLMRTIRNVYEPERLGQLIGHPTSKYIKKYGQVPAWILLKNVTFSSAIDLYSYLNSNVRNSVTHDLLGTKQPSLDYRKALNALYTVRKFRNAIAHNLGFAEYRIRSAKAISRAELLFDFDGTMITKTDSQDVASGDPYSMVLAMILLIKDARLIQNFFHDITNLMLANTIQETVKEKYYKVTNIPINLATRGVSFLDGRDQGWSKEPEWYMQDDSTV